MKWTKAEREFLETARVARLATVGADNRPHNVPICPLFENGKFYLGTDFHTRKVKNIRLHPQVALAFDDYTEDWAHLRGVMVEGEARLLRGSRFRAVRKKIYRKFPQYPSRAPLSDRDSAAVEIIPRKKASWGF